MFRISEGRGGEHLHSTMYLLNQQRGNDQGHGQCNLHSTMYLLNPGRERNRGQNVLIYIPLCIY